MKVQVFIDYDMAVNICSVQGPCRNKALMKKILQAAQKAVDEYEDDSLRALAILDAGGMPLRRDKAG